MRSVPPRRPITALAGSVLLAGVLALVGAPAAFGTPSARNPVGSSVLSRSQVQAKQWWIVRLKLRQAWHISRGAGVTVAVMDTGVDPNFGDLRGALVPGLAVDAQGTDDADPALHGTRMADDIAGRGTGFGLLGVAPRAKIMPVRVPSTAPPQAVGAALDHLRTMAHRPQVVNMSFGGPSPCPGSIATATRKAAQSGMVLVAAAGNTAQAGNLNQYPADCPGVVAVAAVSNNAKVWSDSQRRPYVTLAGPGVNIVGYDPSVKAGYGFADGTSDAAAMVSGAAALLLAKFPTMSGQAVVSRLIGTARQFQGREGTRNNAYGFGVALPYAALTTRVPASTPNPVYAGLTGSRPSGSTSSSSTAAGSSSADPGSSGSTHPSPSSADSSPAAASGSSGSGTSTGLVIGIVVAVIVVVGIIGAVVVRARKRAVHGSSYQ